MPTSIIDLSIAAFFLVFYAVLRLKNKVFAIYYFIPTFSMFLTCIVLQNYRYNGGDLNSYITYSFPHLMAVWNLSYILFRGTLFASLLIFICLFELNTLFYFAVVHSRTTSVSACNASIAPLFYPVSPPKTNANSLILYFLFFLSPSLSLFRYFSGKDNICSALLLFSLFLLFITKYGFRVFPTLNIKTALFFERYSFPLFLLSTLLAVFIRFYYVYYIILPFFIILPSSLHSLSRKQFYLFVALLLTLVFFLLYILNYSTLLFYLDNVSYLISDSEGDFTAAGSSSLSLTPFPFPFSLLQVFRPIPLIDSILYLSIFSVEFSLALLSFLFYVIRIKAFFSLRNILLVCLLILFPCLILSFNANVADNFRKISSLFLFIGPTLLYFSIRPLHLSDSNTLS